MTVTTNYLVTGNGITGSTANAVQALVSRAGNGGPPARRRGAMMLASALNLSTITNTQTYGERRMMPAPFSRVRFHAINKDTSAGGALSLIAAATELGVTVSAAAESRPTVGGVEYTALRASTGAPGWAAVTWDAGSATKAPEAAVGDVLGVASSDWITLRSVPCADGFTGYPLMVRNSVASGSRSYENILNNATAPKVAYTSATARATNWWWPIDGAVLSAGGAVADPSLNLTSDTNTTMAIAWEAEFDVPALQIFAHGDSLTLNGSSTVGQVSGGNWIWQGGAYANKAAAGTVAYCTVIAAKGGYTATQYDDASAKLLAALPPGLFVHPVWSPNDTKPDATSMAVCLENLNRARDLAATYGWRLVCWGQLPNNNYDATDDGYRLAQNNAVKAIALATGEFDYFDLEPTVSDGATPARWISTLNVDATHPNNAGVDAMGVAWGAWLRATYPAGINTIARSAA